MSTGNRWLSLTVVLFLLSPFFILLLEAREISFPPFAIVLEVLLTTTLQAAASAFFSLLFGVVGGLGLLWVGNRWGTRVLTLVSALALLPAAAPVIAMILSVMGLFPGTRGFWGIVFVHALLNIGLIAVAFSRLTRAKVSGLAELAWLEGASSWIFLTRVALPLLFRELLLAAFFVFTLSFVSFAVPLMIGGSRATTLEVLIYEKIRLSTNWSQAVGLSLIQMTFLLAAAWVLRLGRNPAATRRPSPTPLLAWPVGLLAIAFPLIVLLLGLAQGTFNGFASLAALSALLRELPALVANSFIVAAGVGALTSLWLFFLAYLDPRGALRRFLIGYAAPSSALVGFALLILWRDTGLATIVKMVLGLTLIAAPSFYRLEWDAALSGLRGQRETARLLGASEGQIFRAILFPQLIRTAMAAAGLASLWAWGDFSLSLIVAEKPLTVAMAARGLMEAYRLDAATALVWIVLGGGLITFFIFSGVGRVLGAKSQT